MDEQFLAPCDDSIRGLTAPARQATMDLVARWLMLTVLSFYLVFAHGCHGDEDNELFAVVKAAHVTGGALP